MRPLLYALFLTLFMAPVQAADKLRVVADIGPVNALVKAIGGDLVEASDLIPPGVSAHDFALRPSDLKTMRAADLILWSGKDATPALEKSLGDSAIAAKVLDLSVQAGVTLLPLRGDDHGHDDHHGHNDPHLWLSPQNALIWADLIAAQLILLAPSETATFNANKATLAGDIERAITRANTTFARPPLRPYLQYHDAFAYFEAALNLTPAGIATADDEEQASLGKIAKLRAFGAAQPSLCVMISNPAMDRAAEALLVAPDSRLIRAEPLHAENYPALIDALIDSFEACLY